MPIALPEDVEAELSLAFCPTGEGGGVDNSCPPNQGGGSSAKGLSTRKADVRAQWREVNRLNKIRRANPQDDQAKQAHLDACRVYRQELRQLKQKEQELGIAVAPKPREPAPEAGLGGPQPRGDIRKITPAEQRFREATIDRGSPQTEVGGGMNVSLTMKCTMTDGTVVVYKPDKGEPDEDICDYYGVKPGTIAQREAATYELSEALGFGIVPMTTMITDAPEGPGVVLEWVNDARTAFEKGPDELAHWYEADEGYREQAAKMAVLDYLTGNGDRHGNNYIMDVDGHGDLWAIDNGFAFSNKENLTKANIGTLTLRQNTMTEDMKTGIIALHDNKAKFLGMMRQRFKGISKAQRDRFEKRLDALRATVSPGGGGDAWKILVGKGKWY